MEKIVKSFKYRIELSKKQEETVNKTFGSTRFVYNYFLDKSNKVFENTGKTISYNKCSKKLTKLKTEDDFKWLKQVDSTALQSSLRHLSDAFERFFNKESGHPKFHKKRNFASYTSKNNNKSIRLIDDKHLQLPILGIVKIKYSRKIKGKILSATVSRKPSGKYYVSINFEQEDFVKLPKTNKEVGVDLGLKAFAVFSNDLSPAIMKCNKKLERRLLIEQRKLSRMERANILKYDKKHRPIYKRPLSECKNYQKQRVKVAKLREKIFNRRFDFEQKLSTKLVKEYDVITLEDLDVESMLQNKNLSKSIHEASWSEFVKMLQYKAEWNDKKVIHVDKYFPSTQLCSKCGKQKKIQLSERTYVCECGLKIDRDLNAAINIKKEGLRLLAA